MLAIEQIGAPNLRLSIDTYHAAAMGVPLSPFIVRNSSKVGHVQLADWPKRNEPGSGEIDFDAFLRALVVIGYKGFIGLEYIPTASKSDRFNWLRLFDDHLEPWAIRWRAASSPGLPVRPSKFVNLRWFLRI